MSVKIWCDDCHPEYRGLINVVTGFDESGEWGREYIISSKECPTCSGLGCIVKGCENCKLQDVCDNQIELWDEENYELKAMGITFCTAWEKKDEH